MALMKCPDCGKDVSSAAPSCPACGRPIAPPVAPQQAVPPTAPSQPTPVGSTRSCPKCQISIPATAYACPYCKKRLRTSETMKGCLILFGAMVAILWIASLFRLKPNTPPPQAPTSALRPPDPTPSIPQQIYLDASSFVGKRSAAALSLLKANPLLHSIAFDKAAGGYTFRTKDGAKGLLMIFRGQAIGAQVQVPETDSRPELLTAFGVKTTARPSFDQHLDGIPMWIMEWRDIGPFQKAWVWRSSSAVPAVKVPGTTIGVTWDWPAYQKWELE